VVEEYGTCIFGDLMRIKSVVSNDMKRSDSVSARFARIDCQA
jgi:hypothetical protein